MFVVFNGHAGNRIDKREPFFFFEHCVVLLAAESESKQQAVKERCFGVHLVLKVANSFFDTNLQKQAFDACKTKKPAYRLAF
jgi:hypothetical protein